MPLRGNKAFSQGLEKGYFYFYLFIYASLPTAAYASSSYVFIHALHCGASAQSKNKWILYVSSLELAVMIMKKLVFLNRLIISMLLFFTVINKCIWDRELVVQRSAGSCISGWQLVFLRML